MNLKNAWNNLDKHLLVNLGKGAAAALAVGACVSAVINMPPVMLAVLTAGGVYAGAMALSDRPTWQAKVNHIASHVDACVARIIQKLNVR